MNSLKLIPLSCALTILLCIHAQGQNTDYPQDPYGNQNLLSTEPYDHQNNIYLTPNQSGSTQQNNSSGGNLYGNSNPGGPGGGGGGGTPDAGVPIDGGLAFLLTAGAAAGIRKRLVKKH